MRWAGMRCSDPIEARRRPSLLLVSGLEKSYSNFRISWEVTRCSALTLGTADLITVSDGSLVLPLSLPAGVPADELAALTQRFGLTDGEVDPRTLNVSLWRSGGRTVLIDAGSGSQFLPTAGELYDNLDAAGVALDEVTDVVFTHGHPDHLWGILDDFDEIAFPEAALHIGGTEADFWMDPATVDALPEALKIFAVGAARRLEAIADRVQTYTDGDEVVPGLTAVATPGHTPGHMSLRAESGGDSVMILGDAVVNDHLNFARPAWPSGSDHDPETAAATRVRLLGEMADTGMTVIGYHLPGDGIGRVEADGDGFRFVPEGA